MKIKREPLMKEAPRRIFTAINPIAGGLLSSSAHFLFRFTL
jgi:hypothetical protein